MPAPKDIEYTIIESLEALGPRYALAAGYEGALRTLAELGKKVVGETVQAVVEEEIDPGELMVRGIVESSDEEEDVEAPAAIEEEVDEGEGSESEDEDGDEEDEDQVEEDEDFDEDAQEEANEAERQFELEFSRMMKDSLDSRKHAPNTGTFDLAVPKTKVVGASEAGAGLVSFTMLSRGKQQAIELPSDSAFAQSTRMHQKAELEEKRHLKEIVLRLDDVRDDDEEPVQLKQIHQRAIGRDGKWVKRGGGLRTESRRGRTDRKLAEFF